MTALAATADTCPACLTVHGSNDPYWSCPTHGHRLQFVHGSPHGEFEKYDCPAMWPSKCTYTRSAPRRPRTPSKGDTMTTIDTRPSEAVDLMYHRAAHLQQLLPVTIDVGSFIGSAQAALYNNADLMEAAEKSPDSLMIALTECAALGHLPGTKEYYLTPRKDHGRPKILGIEGYRGIVARMYWSGQVAKVTVREVCEKDYFDFTEGQDDYPLHRFGSSTERTGAGFFGDRGSVDRGAMVGVYAYAQLLHGGYTRVSLLSMEDVYAARDSGGYKPTDSYSPWNRMDGGQDHPEFKGRSMWWKTALKRSEPWTPTSSYDKRQPAIAPVRATATVQAPPGEPVEGGQPAPAVQPARRQAITGGARPPARKRGGVVTDALKAALSQHFGRLGLEDPAECEVYVRRLAGISEDGDLGDHDLRTALGKLGDCQDIGALQAACDTPAAP